MLFMVIERFRDADLVPVYRHMRAKGRGLPEGLRVVESWIEASYGRCFQVMECDDARLLQAWLLHWRGLGIDFEIVPVVRSEHTREVVTPHLDRPDAP